MRYVTRKLCFSGETQKLNMYQAINHGLALALENDPRTGDNLQAVDTLSSWNV